MTDPIIFKQTDYKQSDYKQPESILVVIYCPATENCLMLQRQDDPHFWQSVTGSLEIGELPKEAAVREVMEETGVDIIGSNLSLIDAQHTVSFEIFPQFRHRYAPNVTINREHWFYLPLPTEIMPKLTEHLAYQWLPYDKAAKLTLSPNNGEAIKAIERYVDSDAEGNVCRR
ncbi:dihydroneopterin triphosphate diphosphatase [Orbaceae bacterium ESL0721]|nr:dihydroneopterin triphosphate diphosphatase [Orbaceae bacterium ESL0721]